MPISAVGNQGLAPISGGQAKSAPGFGKMLADAIDKVNQLEITAQEGSMKLAAGEVTDIHQVMLAAEKAETALDLTIAVRNKVLEAYQEIMRMPV